MTEIVDEKLINLIDTEKVISFKDEHFKIVLRYSKEKQTLFYDLTNTIDHFTQQFGIEDFLLGGIILHKMKGKGHRDFITAVTTYWDYKRKESKYTLIMNYIIGFTEVPNLIWNLDNLNSSDHLNISIIKTALKKNNYLLFVGGELYIDNLIESINKNANFEFLALLLTHYHKTELYDFDNDFININIPLTKTTI